MTTSEPDNLAPDNRAFRLARRGRAVDSDFLPEEQLYRRCPVTELDPDNPERLFPDQISFYPDWSVNREKYSEPQDLLYLEPEYLGLGVAAFQVQDIPPPIETEGKVIYRWDAQHHPLEENYSHSEIWTYKNDIHLANPKSETDPKPPKLPNTVKKHFRTILSERARIICVPQSQHGPL